MSQFSSNESNANANAAAPQQEFGIQRIYVKDLSFEAPHVPEIFRTDWVPEINLDLNTTIKKISDDLYEVTLKVTATVKAKDKVAFLIEVQQAGIFILKGFIQDQLQEMLGGFCPNILFPYAREVVSDVVNRATFPPLYLAPVNFDVLYQQHLEQQRNQPATSAQIQPLENKEEQQEETKQ